MLYRKNNEWRLCPFKVTYEQYGEQHEQYAHDTQWWEDFVQLWSHTTIISIDDVTYTDEQIARYEQIKYLPEDFSDVYSAYVSDGTILDGTSITPTHPFNLIVLKHKEVVNLQYQLLNPHQRYLQLNLSSTSLEELKQAKIAQLDYLCTQTILGRFSVELNGNVYEFSYDTEAQLRFTGIAIMLMNNSIQEIEWTTYLDNERIRIPLTKQDFDTVSQSALIHQNTNVVRYNQLLQLVNACETKEGVDTIDW